MLSSYFEQKRKCGSRDEISMATGTRHAERPEELSMDFGVIDRVPAQAGGPPGAYICGT